MKVKVLKETSNELKIEVEGIGHGLCNLIQKRLLEEEDVDLAGYDIPHPLASNPIIYIRTKGRAQPKGVLFRALKNARKTNDNFRKEFEKALKKT
ncbi:MAG: RpoL/Rpb11 RNA polymerase subunit family protein [Candidatus Bathyarchaeales archaeon]